MASFKNRRLMAWLAFFILCVIIVVSLAGVVIANESIVNTILICLTSIIVSYFTGVSYEAVKKPK